jgi:hypothetical protein
VARLFFAKVFFFLGSIINVSNVQIKPFKPSTSHLQLRVGLSDLVKRFLAFLPLLGCRNKFSPASDPAVGVSVCLFVSS